MEAKATNERAWRWGEWSAADRDWQTELEKRHAEQLQSEEGRPPSAMTIPRIIHHIWLGPREIPAWCATWMESWRTQHPSWTHRLWRDEDVEPFGLKNEKAYTDAKNYGEKSDILRYEILERLGGVYVDVDMQCLQPIDSLTEKFAFVVGISNTGCMEINNAVIASTDGHPILKRLIDKIHARANKPKLDAGALARIAQLSGVDLAVISDTSPPMATIEHTGPGLMTRTFMEAVGWSTSFSGSRRGFLSSEEQAAAIALPVHFFYPLPNNLTEEEATRTQTAFPSQAVAVHHWQRTWIAGI